MNGNASHIASGSYNNTFRVFGSSGSSGARDAAGAGETTLEASRDPMRKRLQTPPAKSNRFALRKAMALGGKGGRGGGGEAGDAGSDYASKLLHLAWHPEANVVACAAANSLYMYCA